MRLGLANARRQRAPLLRYLLMSVVFVVCYLSCLSWWFLGNRATTRPVSPQPRSPGARGPLTTPPPQSEAMEKQLENNDAPNAGGQNTVEAPQLGTSAMPLREVPTTALPLPSLSSPLASVSQREIERKKKSKPRMDDHPSHAHDHSRQRVHTLLPRAHKERVAGGPMDSDKPRSHRFGVDLPDADHEAAVQRNPGGTEEEALAFRRALSKFQWPAVRDVHKVQWRTMPDGGDVTRDHRQSAQSNVPLKKEPDDDGATSLERYLAALEGSRLLLDDASGAVPTARRGGDDDPEDRKGERYASRLPFNLASREPYRCPPFDFSCRISAYASGALPAGHSTNPLCNDVYGHGLLERFRRAREILCGDGGEVRAAADSPTSSTVSCAMVMVHATHDVATSVCRAERFRVRFDRILNGDYPWLSFQPGALDLHCHDTARGAAVRHQRGTFIHCLADWLELGYSSYPSPASGGPSASWAESYECDSVVSTPTLFVTRSGDYSPFALSHDWLNTVILAAAERIPVEDLQVVVMDRMHVGFYTPVWQMGFSPNHEVLWWHDLKEAAMQSKHHATCYERAWFNIPARLSPIYDEDECGGEGAHAYASPVYHVFRDHILSRLGALRTVGGASLSEVANMGDAQDSTRGMATVVVTLIMRKNYATGHAIGRRIANADALTAALRQTLNTGLAEDKSGAPNLPQTTSLVVVNQVDFAAHDFPLQLNISRATDVLVAMHGAGLAQMMFMHPWGGVFEFFCPEKPSSNYRYRQLANKMGLRYKSYSIQSESNEVPLGEAVPLLVELVRSVQKDKAQMLGLYQ